MASSTVTPRESSEPQSYADFVTGLSYALYELAYQAQAARALLHEYEQTQKSEELTGVSYLLSRLTAGCKELSEDVSGTAYSYSLKSAVGHE